MLQIYDRKTLRRVRQFLILFRRVKEELDRAQDRIHEEQHLREEEQRLREEKAREVEIARQQAAELQQLRETQHDEHEDGGHSGGEPPTPRSPLPISLPHLQLSSLSFPSANPTLI